jgi:superfamily II DNA/RNA helicase
MPSVVWRAGLSNELLAGCGVQSARAAVIVGGEGIEEQVGLLESGSADLVIGTPQRFWDVINSATAVRHRCKRLARK